MFSHASGWSRLQLFQVWLATFVVFLGLYYWTCQRGVSWQDSGNHQYRILTKEYRSEFGLAVAHPLYIAAGRVALQMPIEDAATRVNLLSSLGMSVALANLAVLAALLGRVWVGLAVAGMLGTAHTVWWLATIAEGYAWVAAGLMAELWIVNFLLQNPSWRLLALLGLVSGMGWGVHNFALLPLPIYLAVVACLLGQKRLSGWSLIPAVAAYAIGSLPLTLLIAEHWREHGSLLGALQNALFGNQFQGDVLNLRSVHENLKITLALGSLNFANLLLPSSLVGLFYLRQRLGNSMAAVVGLVAAMELLFFARYPVHDQIFFMIPTLFMVALIASVGLAAMADWGAGWKKALVAGSILSILFAPLLYATLPSLLHRAGWAPRRARPLAYRDETRYWVVPWKHNEHSARRFAEEALAVVPQTAVIIAGDTAAAALRAAQAASDQPSNVRIIKKATSQRTEREAFLESLARHPLYIVAPASFHAPRELLERVRLEPRGVLERAQWRD